ncbi:hypothetical protein RDI58_026952 [Solanum bulbocastanum]|uniref:Uncharacterized protein n=1 Tax=Solanum bulbocastanum TaxID=147425 RepID=A0AAN8SZX9_SOLBU
MGFAYEDFGKELEDKNDGDYGCEYDGGYGGYDDSHDQELYGNESYYSRGEYERNVEHSSNTDKKALVVAPMMMKEHVKGLTLTPRVKMVPMMKLEHITLPTPRMKVR